MVKTYGSVDRKQRKTRSDVGKKRKKYGGKPVKGRTKRTPYIRKISEKQYLRIFVWEEVPMSKSGRLRWNKNNRRFAHSTVWKPRRVHEVHVSEIENQQKMEQWVADNYYPGTFVPKGFSNASNKYRCKQVRLCRVVVRENDKGQYGQMTNNFRLHRYKWFYKDE